ncbi:hypothetical protein RQP53_03635 [Paucibacter sp. APW11]|uniref:HTH cro/C1-type domain-containing protein n=1 Tax=Roseateles aquae TaxID=3077235 RepID=A0ABU3P749_9BURK|nr:hypothetical protein [Paucibacter sp. APW11]MDT8998365.1 hypothetical protein [Paucibacter sp. APW11]
MDLQHRLEHVMRTMGWDRGDLIRISKQSSSVVSQWLGHGSKPIKSIAKLEAAEALARASGFNALWIARGKGAPRPADDDAIAKGVWPFERVTLAQLLALDPAMRARLEAMIEGAIACNAPAPFAATRSAWHGTAMQIAAAVDAVNRTDQFTRFIESIDRQFESARPIAELPDSAVKPTR